MLELAFWFVNFGGKRRRRAQFEQALRQFDGTVLVAVHDRYFIERFADEVWWVEAGSLTRRL